MNVETNALTRRKLDYAVALALKLDPQYNRVSHGGPWYGWTVVYPKRIRHMPMYHRDWNYCGPILEDMWKRTIYANFSFGDFCLEQHATEGENPTARGSTPQEAILRLFVLKELGTEVTIPIYLD